MVPFPCRENSKGACPVVQAQLPTSNSVFVTLPKPLQGLRCAAALAARASKYALFTSNTAICVRCLLCLSLGAVCNELFSGVQEVFSNHQVHSRLSIDVPAYEPGSFLGIPVCSMSESTHRVIATLPCISRLQMLAPSGALFFTETTRSLSCLNGHNFVLSSSACGLLAVRNVTHVLFDVAYHTTNTFKRIFLWS